MTRALLPVCLAFLTAPFVAQADGPDHPKADPNGLIDHSPAVRSQVAGGADLSGVWQIIGHIDDGGAPRAQASPVCEFKQGDRTLTGHCKGPHAEGPASGVIAGRHVSWKWQASATSLIGVSSAAWFQGDVGADGVIRGTWSLEQLPGLKGEFTQTRK
jgi:hypothetical protein